jgi:hypothetical protein
VGCDRRKVEWSDVNAAGACRKKSKIQTELMDHKDLYKTISEIEPHWHTVSRQLPTIDSSTTTFAVFCVGIANSSGIRRQWDIGEEYCNACSTRSIRT